MVRALFVFLLLVMSLSGSCFAQVYPTQYRPPNQQWQYLKTPHFKILYSAGNDSAAFQTGRLFEEHYGPVQKLVGGQLNDFPVILNDYNDISSGFVTSTHFRAEIELPPSKSKSHNPQTGNWLETVVPHELVHALQFNNLGDWNIPQFVSFFSPDFARSIHGAIPSGITEGIAVHHETESVAPNGGRGNYPVFTNQFNAIFKSNDPWSMGQMVQRVSDSRPFNRHYIGGYEFTAWLQDEYGPATTRKALDFYMDYPFLGYGVALRHVTGLWPGRLYDQFERAKQKSLGQKDTDSLGKKLAIPFKGREIHRPKWLSDSTLIFYGSFYNARQGFYTYDLATENLDRILTTNSVNDYRYDITADRSEMVFSYYEADAKYNNASKAELVRYNFSSGHKEQVTKKGRVYSPVYFGDELVALQTQPVSSKLVTVHRKNSPDSTNELISLGEHEIISVDVNPQTDQLAVIVNKRGLQGLWITNKNELNEELTGLPDISFEKGSVFDPEWHPGGNKIMFSSDFSGSHQLYEYNLKTDTVIQITQEMYNAFEGSYSPNADRIAYIKQANNERLPVVLNRTEVASKTISKSLWQPSSSKTEFMQRPVVSDSMITASREWETGHYSTGYSWLKPRTILPVFDEISNRSVYQAGLSLQSNNLLSNQTYSADLSYAQDRLWYDLTYQNKTFFPGFKVSYYSRPGYLSIPSQGTTSSTTLLRQNRSLALSTPFFFRLNQNVYSTSFFVEPEIRHAQLRLFRLESGNRKTDFTNLTIGNIHAQFNFRLQQNIRDLQPNSGLILFSEVERYLNSTSISLIPLDFTQSLGFDRSFAIRGGIYSYVSPLRRWNQSLRLGFSALAQTDPVFDTQSLVSNAFSEPVLEQSRNLVSFSTRYTIPLWYVDDGGFLLPFYLSKVYLVGLSNTVTDPTFDDWREGSRTVFAIGLRTRFRLSNLAFDLGVGFGYEPTRGNTHFFFGNF